MTQMVKPLPALYTVYVLRSTVRHASLYIGSTPNPPRRLKQHNGDSKGGALRTSTYTLRPWEMITVVSGFPSMVAALKFEWALTNSHISLHIPAESRVSIATRRKKNGMPRKPIPSLKSVMANIHLLTGVPSFARWPLNVHFFATEAYEAWQNRLESTQEPGRRGLRILTDFAGPDRDVPEDSQACGVHALPLDYRPMANYVEKAHAIIEFEQQGNCVHCSQELEPGQGLHALCPNDGCKAMGHLDCWSRHALSNDGSGHIIPDQCSCPTCGGNIRWGDMMKELSLRIRGSAEVKKVLKSVKRAKKLAAAEVKKVLKGAKRAKKPAAAS
ncbi:hypothetical protein E4U54_001429 [Claviceps lovelessii]|nr:hypothetical protein E4U54_001429 [Claviceps lovelessii]